MTSRREKWWGRIDSYKTLGQHRRFAAETRGGRRQALQIAEGFHVLTPAQVADDVLARTAVLVDALDEIDLGVLADALVAEKHGGLLPVASARAPKTQAKAESRPRI